MNPITHQPVETVNQTIQDSEAINYRRLSYQLGLHKDSLNHVSRQLSSSKVKSLYKLR